MFTFVFLILSFGYNGVQIAYADNIEPTCYSRFDYDMRMFETVADLKQNQKAIRDVLEKLEAKVAARDTVNKLQNLVEKLEAKVADQEQERQESSPGSGSTYVRWGRTVCPDNGTTLIYKGYTGGSFYNHAGSGSDYQCLPEDPTWGTYQDGTQGDKAYMYGAEYEPSSLHFDSLVDKEVPCAVCLSIRSSVIMIPARTSCYPGWTFEYEGNLASAFYGAKRTQYTCMDKEAEPAPIFDPSNNNGALFYAVEGRCGSLPCPPYVEGRELACVLCSK